jgi:hypothetical protein
VATRARFGRLPRSAPSLTATIVALAQQYEAQRERNLFDAWNNGGDWEGKKATDEVLMKYLKEKLAGLDKDDPNANEIRIKMASYEFAIENSKMEVKYAQKKVSDAGMAAFYRKWAAKLPVNSEAYRERAKLAAQYADRAHATVARGRRAASDDGYYKRQSDIGNAQIRPFADLYATVEEYARKGIIGYIAPALNTTNEGLADLRVNEGDATVMLSMLDQLATDPALGDWRKSYIDSVRKYGGQISGSSAFTQQGLAAMADQAIAGYNAQIAEAKRSGRKGDVAGLRKERDKVKATKSVISTIDEKSEYEDARKDWLEIVRDPDASVKERIAATDAYKARLLDFARRAEKAGDTVGAGRYNTEFLAANGGRDLNGKDVDVRTGPTMWESSRPTAADRPTDKEGNVDSDAFSTAQSVREMEGWQAMLDYRDENGLPLFAQVRLDDKGEPTTDTRYGFGVVPVSKLGDAVVYTTTDGDARNGKPGVLTATLGKRVTVLPETEPDANGAKAQVRIGGNADEVVLGGTFTMDDGTVLYAYEDDKGDLKYTDKNPFTNAVESDGKGGMVVRITLNEKGKENAEKNGLDRASFVQPDYRSSELNKNQPNTVFSSPQAWEMARDPVKTYSKYTSADLDAIAAAQSKGSATKYATIRDELDTQRAEYIKKGGLNYDQTLRLASARLNGNLPLLSDHIGGVTATGFDIRGSKIDNKENRALAEKFGGDSKAAANIIADTVQKQWGYTPANIEQARKTGVIEKYGPPAPTTTKSMAEQSRALASGLIKDIWWNATKPVGAGVTAPAGTAGPKAPVLGPRPSPAPPAPKPSGPPAPKPTAPPKPTPTAPKPTAPPKPTPPPPAPKPPSRPMYGPPAPSRAPGAPGSPVYGPPAPTKGLSVEELRRKYGVPY